MLRIQAECEADSNVIFCSKTGPENFNPMESYIERNDLESTEDNEEERRRKTTNDIDKQKQTNRLASQ